MARRQDGPSRTAKPEMRWPEKDAAWQDVALGIREVAEA